MKIIKALMAVAFLTGLLTGCPKPINTAEDMNSQDIPVAGEVVEVTAEETTEPTVITLEEEPAFSGHPLDDPSSLLATTTIYFDLDRFDIEGDSKAVVEAHATYLADHPDASVTLEGHTDERGSREYNITLGEKRAKAAAKIFRVLGASRQQSQTISYGEERPVSFGHNEDAWRMNRRVEIIYTSR